MEQGSSRKDWRGGRQANSRKDLDGLGLPMCIVRHDPATTLQIFDFNAGFTQHILYNDDPALYDPLGIFDLATPGEFHPIEDGNWMLAINSQSLPAGSYHQYWEINKNQVPVHKQSYNTGTAFTAIIHLNQMTGAIVEPLVVGDMLNIRVWNNAGLGGSVDLGTNIQQEAVFFRLPDNTLIVKLQCTTPFTCTHAVTTSIPWDTAQLGTLNNPMVVPGAGKLVCFGNAIWEANTVGERDMAITPSPLVGDFAAIEEVKAASSADAGTHGSFVWGAFSVAAGDTLNWTVRQQSGGDLDCLSAWAVAMIWPGYED